MQNQQIIAKTVHVRRDALHAVHFHVHAVPAGQGARYLVNGLLVHLHAVDGQPGAGEQLLVANVALEVLGLLVLDQDLLVLEFPVAIP